ncbi:MAG: hypothetical protein OCC49_15565 [Fibrobacterales bacterium]
MEEDSTYSFIYTFYFDDGEKHHFKITILKEDTSLIVPPRTEFPAWTELNNCKCPNCPLDDKEVSHCPMAVSIIDVVETFNDVFSYEEVSVTVTTPDRTYMKKAGLQEGLSSIMGLYMATSGCPNLKKMRPMAAHHLPFASLDDTIYRVLSMYALAQLLKNRKNNTFNSDFSELKELYENIGIVNTQFCERLRGMLKKDANVNAVVILNNFAEFVPFSISEDMLEDLEKLFNDFLE